MNTDFKSTKTPCIQVTLFWAILLFAFLIRIIGLDSVPTGINQDEAMGAMDAWALSQYGTDRFGMQLPVHFTAWEYGQMSVLLSYCMVPFIKLFGFSTFAVRLPMVLASVMGVALMYHISKRYFSVNMSLAVMAFTAINPYRRSETPPKTAFGIVDTSAVNLLKNPNAIAIIAASPITQTDATFVIPTTDVFSPYVVFAGPPINPATKVAIPSPNKVLSKPGSLIKSLPIILLKDL